VPRKIHRLTEAEQEIIAKSRDDGRYFTDYFFGGWVFDHNIDPPWQLRFHHAPEPELTVIGGIGSSKTTAVGMSAATWSATTRSFKFMNVAPTLYQSVQMFEIILANAEGNRFDTLVFKAISKPYPKIVLKFRVGNTTNTSSLEFMSAADDANRILSWEGDWINIDEAGLLDDLDETIVRLGTRLRGTVKGRARLGRLSLTTNPHVNSQLYYRFDLAQDMPDEYLSIQASTRSNKNITERQLESLIRRIPEHERERWLEGTRPEGAGKEFPLSLVEGCEDEGMDALMERGIENETRGYVFVKAPKAGVVTWQLPAEEGRSYVIIMDPGQGVPPWRNAPVVIVLDVTDFPSAPADLRAFWWGFGDGSYQPCIGQFKYYYSLYRAAFGVFDSTGTQVGMQEYFRLEEDMLAYGMSLAGNVKGESLLALKLLMGRQLMRWPKGIKGIHQQLVNYRLPDKKVVQDIVSALMIGANFIRRFYYEELPSDVEENDVVLPIDRHERRTDVDRYARTASR